MSDRRDQAKSQVRLQRRKLFGAFLGRRPVLAVDDLLVSCLATADDLAFLDVGVVDDLQRVVLDAEVIDFVGKHGPQFIAISAGCQRWRGNEGEQHEGESRFHDRTDGRGEEGVLGDGRCGASEV